MSIDGNRLIFDLSDNDRHISATLNWDKTVVSVRDLTWNRLGATNFSFPVPERGIKSARDILEKYVEKKMKKVKKSEILDGFRQNGYN